MTVFKYFMSAFFVTMFVSAEAHAVSLGGALENVAESFSTSPKLFSAFAYIAGAMTVTWGIFSFRDHVDGRSNVTLSMAVKRMLMGGMLLALPAVLQATVETWVKDSASAQGLYTGPGTCDSGTGALDAVAVCFISDIAEPMAIVLSAFTYIGGILLVLLAITRITKTYQEGARGPTGIGTIMTLLSGGALISSGQMMAAFSTSIFGDATAVTNPVFSGTIGDAVGDDNEVIQTTISAILAFVGIVGWIAFIRGWFVLRSVADGNSQATMPQALTFLFGGALAVNLGDVVNALSASLGDGLGIAFT